MKHQLETQASGVYDANADTKLVKVRPTTCAASTPTRAPHMNRLVCFTHAGGV